MDLPALNIQMHIHARVPALIRVRLIYREYTNITVFCIRKMFYEY